MKWRLARRQFLELAIGGSVAASCATSNMAPQGDRRPPNIVMILADDFGVGDITALGHGGKVPTPYLDRLVRESIRFTDAHSASAVCSPTRYGLLTGRYCWRTRLQNWVLDAYEPPLIAEDRLTLPGMLKQRGYTTACIGKWHLGWDWPGEGEGPGMQPDFTQPILSGPTTRGFDYYFGTDVPNFPPFAFIENDRVVEQPTDTYVHDPTLHMGKKTGPMAPGWKFDTILPAITQKAVQYIQDYANGNAPFFLYFPMTSPHEPIAPSPSFKGKSGIAPIADFLMETDWSAGQVIEALDNAGIANDTIVIFAGDNGHSHYTGWDKLIAAGHTPSGAYRGHKGQIWEGGHRVPLLVRWPGVVDPGSQSDQLICLNDIMATCAAIVGLDLPENAAEDSINMLDVLTGAERGPIRQSLVNHDVKGAFAYRQGPWKLVIVADKALPPTFELYNLADDPSESSDLSAQYPRRVRDMLKALQDCVRRGRSTEGSPQLNDTPDINVHQLPKERWGRPA